MRRFVALLVVAGCLMLTACASGGGGGPASSGTTTPPPPPPPPPPPNTSLTALHSSQTFAGAAPRIIGQIGNSSGAVQDFSPGNANVSVSYDATSNSYSVTFAGAPAGSETFAATTKDASSTAGMAVYKTTNGAVSETLTLTSQSPSSGAAFNYVAAGSWRRDQQNSTEDDAFYQPFVYGFPTGSTPHSGSAGYNVDVDGFIAFDNKPPRTTAGTGVFNADFLSGLFSLNASVTETNQVTGAVGETAPLTSSGHLASDGSFTGAIAFASADSAYTGTLNGALYGPQASEVGATFLVSTVDGAFAGSVIGTQNSSGVAENLSLSNPLVTQQFAARDVVVGEDILTVGGPAIQHVTTFTLNPGGGGTYQTVSGLAASLAATDQVSDPGSPYAVYRNGIPQGAEELDLYKPGAANDELALSYAGFGEWSLSNPSDPNSPRQEFFTYGLVTPYWTMTTKTGTAQYSGVIHGGAEVEGTSVRYDLSGTVNYSMNFSAQSYTGILAIQGVNLAGGASRDFGVFNVSGDPAFLNAGNVFPAFDFTQTSQNGVNVGYLSNRFFGPTGEEIAGVFNITVGGGSGPPTTNLAGVAVAKRN